MIAAYALRPATPDDYEFVRALHRETLKEYVTALWGWDDELQEKLLRERFSPEKVQIIRCDGRDIGLIQLERRPEEWLLVNIWLSPAHQRRGLGTRILRDLLHEADQARVALALTVLKPNPAKRLYERLGFTVVRQDTVRFFMKREPHLMPTA